MKSVPDNPLETRLSVRLTPRASQNAVVRYADGALSLRLTAPPVQKARVLRSCYRLP